MSLLLKTFVFSFLFFTLLFIIVFFGNDIVNKQGVYHPLLFSQFSKNFSPLKPQITPQPVAVVGNGDANANTLVDFGDIHFISNNWNALANGSVDQYQDQKINALDFAVVANQLTQKK